MKYLLLILLITLLYFSFKPSFKIDVVYTWVDGNDPVWKAKKNKLKDDGSFNARFVSINELKYSLRSLYKYAPWVNKIYIVVDDDQVPSFVNEKNPKIKIIKHSEIMDPSHLPVFNSVAIEANIHHIPGLSENFLYFNDDMFLGQPIKPEDILNICYYVKNLKHSYFSELVPNDPEWLCNLKQNHLMLNKKVKNEYIAPTHQALFCKKSLMYELEHMFPDEHKHTSTQKLRKQKDDNFICNSFLLPKMQCNLGIAKGIYKAVPEKNVLFITPNEISFEHFQRSINSLKTKKFRFFCINSTDHADITLDFLENYFNFKCPYEK